MPLAAPVIRAVRPFRSTIIPSQTQACPTVQASGAVGAADPDHQNDRSPPVSWLVRKLAKKNPK
jgi:hypothetical protein